MPPVKKTALPAFVGELSLWMFGWCNVEFGVAFACPKGEGAGEDWFRQPAPADLKPLTFILSPYPRGEATQTGRIAGYHDFYDGPLPIRVRCHRVFARRHYEDWKKSLAERMQRNCFRADCLE